MMLKFIVFSFLLGVGVSILAQVPEYDYFPAALCKAEGLKTVTVFESKIDDPNAKGNAANQIRIAKNIVREVSFGENGKRLSAQRFNRGGKIVEQEMLYTYDAKGNKTTDENRYFNTNLVDSTKVIFQTATRYQWNRSQQCIGHVKYLGDVLSDSTVYVLDDAGKILRELVYHYTYTNGEVSVDLLQEKVFTYTPGKLIVTSQPAGGLPNVDEFGLDAEGRKIRELNFAPKDSVARLETRYSYDAKGRLLEIVYVPDWRYFTKSETVVLRKNKYNAHGILVEAQMDFADGKRLLEFYDLSHWNED